MNAKASSEMTVNTQAAIAEILQFLTADGRRGSSHQTYRLLDRLYVVFYLSSHPVQIYDNRADTLSQMVSDPPRSLPERFAHAY